MPNIVLVLADDMGYGDLGGNVHYFNHRALSDLHVLFRGRLPAYQRGCIPHLITDEAIAFVERHKDRPFFLFVSHECPHFPFQGPNDREKQEWLFDLAHDVGEQRDLMTTRKTDALRLKTLVRDWEADVRPIR